MQFYTIVKKKIFNKPKTFCQISKKHFYTDVAVFYTRL